LSSPQEVLLGAVKSGHHEVVERFLAQNPDLASDRDELGLSLLLIAIYHGHTHIADFLADHLEQLDVFEACALGRLDRVAELVSLQPDLVNSYNVDGFQPLGLACFFGRENIITTLLSAGAQVNSPSRNDLRVSPLHSAVASQNLAIAERLLAAGAAVDARQAGGFTPLHGAAFNGQLEMVKLLLDNGADPRTLNDQGQSSLDIARERGHVSVGEFLQIYITG
jgi:uncharacterized protein